MMRSNRDAVVVITGASSGIGRAAAHAFAAAGASVVLAARAERPLQEAARECIEAGGQSLAVPTDVTSEEAVKALAQRAIGAFGRIDVWVNNAAVSLFGRIEDTPLDAYQRVIQTNLFGYVHGARAVIPHFRAQGSGVLINVSSSVALTGQPYTSAYVASKCAIQGLSECLRQELLDVPGIQVCTVLPASLDTPLFQHAANYTGRRPQAMKPIYDPEMVADAIVRLAEHPRRETIAGEAGWMAVLGHAIAPTLTERVMARRVETDHLGLEETPNSQGNLFEPMPEVDGLHGGWREMRRDGEGLSLAASGLVLLGISAGILTGLRRRTRHRDDRTGASAGE